MVEEKQEDKKLKVLTAKFKPGDEVYVVVATGKADIVAKVEGPLTVACVHFQDQDSTVFEVARKSGGYTNFSAEKLSATREEALKVAGELQEQIVKNLWGQFAQANVVEKDQPKGRIEL